MKAINLYKNNIGTGLLILLAVFFVIGIDVDSAKAAGTCGPAARFYTVGETTWSGSFCGWIDTFREITSPFVYPDYGDTTKWECGAWEFSLWPFKFEIVYTPCQAEREILGNQAPVGVVDLSTCGEISGWVWDKDGVNPVDVDIYIDGGLVGSSVIRTDRADSGYSPLAGYEFSFDNSAYRDGVNHNVQVVATDDEGDSSTLTGTDAVFACPICGPAAKVYDLSDSFPDGTLCVGGNANPSSFGSLSPGSDHIWRCEENAPGTYYTECTATMTGNPMVITDPCPECGDPVIDFTIEAVPLGCL